MKKALKFLDESDVAKLLMLCGCLNDIAEKTKEEITAKQVKVVQQKLEKILCPDELIKDWENYKNG